MFTSPQTYEYISQKTNDPIIEWKICNWTGVTFPIFASEKETLEQISPVINGKRYYISLPNLCPEARQIHRMLFRNDRSFYKTIDDLYGKSVISIYYDGFPGKIYEANSWFNDLDATKYAQDMGEFDDISLIMKRLTLVVPRLNVGGVGNENSDYCNYCGYCKNGYLDIAGENNEDCYYCTFTKYSKRCVDCTFVYESEWCYQSVQVYNSNRIVYGQSIEACSDCFFCFDLQNCHHCLWCHNLKGKDYYIHNKPVSKKVFEQTYKKIFSGDFSIFEKAKQEFINIRKDFIYRDLFAIACENSVGDNIKNAHNSKSIFNATNIDESMYLYDVLNAKKCLDLNYSLYHPEFSYNLMSTLELKKSVCNVATTHSTSVFYCQLCNHCSDCFGCIGLSNKSYCIFNKQYTKQEYFEKLSVILNELISQNKFGYYFDPELSFHPYNDTFAMDHFPIKEIESNGQVEVLNEKGVGKVTILEPEKFISKAILDLGGKEKIPVLWRTKSKEINIDATSEKLEKFPENIREIDEDITKKIAICSISKRPFRYIHGEIDFYKTLGVPLPRVHYDIRHEQRNKLLAARHLQLGKCDKSGEIIIFSDKKNHEAKIYSQAIYEKEVE